MMMRGLQIGEPRLPLEFWRVLHSEYGIVVYPSAFTEDIEVQGLGTDVTFTEAYQGHISEAYRHPDRTFARANNCRSSDVPSLLRIKPPPSVSVRVPSRTSARLREINKEFWF
jgi:hypothetical protein